jgi:deferrochelatase/peroxidase EfeB
MPLTAALNQFTYVQDPQGMQCPVGAHIRRTNPRTGDYPPGVTGLVSRLVRALGFGLSRPDADLIASSRFHRLVRRGRNYGPPLAPEEAARPDAPAAARGLQFICLVGNITRQFEFVQNAWIESGKFGGVQDERDPLLGTGAALLNGAATDRFRQPDASGPARTTHALPQFVTVKGGGYFFMPGLRALKYLAGLPNQLRGRQP